MISTSASRFRPSSLGHPFVSKLLRAGQESLFPIPEKMKFKLRSGLDLWYNDWATAPKGRWPGRRASKGSTATIMV